MKKLITLLGILLLGDAASAQNGGIAGLVKDSKLGPLINAQVIVTQAGAQKGRAMTDYDGNYVVKPLPAGTYNVEVTYQALRDITEDVSVAITGLTTVNVNFGQSGPAGTTLEGVMVRRNHGFSRPLIEERTGGGTKTMVAEEIEAMPITNTSGIASLSTQSYQHNNSGGVSLGGAQATGTTYIVAGSQLAPGGGTFTNAPPGSVTQTFPIAGGVPAKHRDTSGGVIQLLSGEGYSKIHENDFSLVKVNPLSTLSVDVDRAAYSNIRRMVNNMQKVPPDAVRIEEMINYFSYDYPQPWGNDPIAIVTELAVCPWNGKHKLLHVAMKAREIATESLPASNLVFLVDVSGSMAEENKLPLVISSLKLLVNSLRPADRVAIVVYAGAAGLVLPSTPGSQKSAINGALERLSAGGSTAGGAGIQLAYKIALDNFMKAGNNRIILCTDGDFNVGVSSEGGLEDLIVQEREKGIFLSVLGYGTGNYQDEKMQILADKGNGNHAYIDNLKEAHKTLISEFGGTLFTVARDVKAQIEFNPAHVQAYRLVGYENRLLKTEDFKDDKKDAGEMGSGHTVTILYEIIPSGVSSTFLPKADSLKYTASVPAAGNAGDLATIKFRYKLPTGKKSIEMIHVIPGKTVALSDATENMRFASSVGMFGLALRGSKYMVDGDWTAISALAKGAMGKDIDGYRGEFVDLIDKVRVNKLAVR